MMNPYFWISTDGSGPHAVAAAVMPDWSAIGLLSHTPNFKNTSRNPTESAIFYKPCFQSCPNLLLDRREFKGVIVGSSLYSS